MRPPEPARRSPPTSGSCCAPTTSPRWLAASALNTLLLEASKSLLELSGGQFELTHDGGGDLLIVDHADADSRRPVKTLSGGETFQASLALALALSSQMAALAQAGAARLDSIFLDEGFGTLDEATLEIVADTLENLAGQKERMVGVITHVPALAERIPVKFQVARDAASSRASGTAHEPPAGRRPTRRPPCASMWTPGTRPTACPSTRTCCWTRQSRKVVLGVELPAERWRRSTRRPA